MKKGLLLLVLTVAVALCQLNARVIFVKAGSNGNGSSWENAFGDLQLALKAAKAGDQIWVAAGKYLPTRNDDRTVSFRLVEGVALYGGFAGFESTLDQRNIAVNKTCLSGEIGSPSIDDNSFTVIYAEFVSPATIVDGFTITGGAANAFDYNPNPNICGGGWFNHAASPAVRNCTFVDNYAREGAAIYNFAGNATSNPQIVNCRFISNKADLDGGAIYNNGNNGICSPRIEKCHFEGNISTYGAGILNTGVNGETKPIVLNSVFVNNSSLIRGGAIYNHREGKGICEAIVSACRFDQNLASVDPDVSNTLSNGITTESGKSGVVLRSSGY